MRQCWCALRQCFLQSSTAELEWTTNASRRLAGSNIMFKSFPPGSISEQKPYNAVQSSSWLHRKSVADEGMNRFLSLQMESWIGLLRMYVAFNSCEVTMLEKASVFNVAQIMYSSFSGSCYVIFVGLENVLSAVTLLGEKNVLNWIKFFLVLRHHMKTILVRVFDSERELKISKTKHQIEENNWSLPLWYWFHVSVASIYCANSYWPWHPQ